MNDQLILTLKRRLEQHNQAYFPDLPANSVRVELTGVSIRLSSALYRFRVSADSRDRLLLVKVRLQEALDGSNGQDEQTPLKRPRLGTSVDIAKSYELELQALSTIETHFKSLSDPRFDVIRVLDSLPHHLAIVMTESTDPSLRKLLASNTRLHILMEKRRDLEVALGNAGAWLNIFQSITMPVGTPCRHQSRAEFINSINDFTDFLADRHGQRPSFQRIAASASHHAEQFVPAALPIGLLHGDFAPRNILIGDPQSVTVIDTLARTYGPIYDDIAYFMISMKANRSQAFTQGLAFSRQQINRHCQAFVNGYFGDQPVPWPTIWLFEILALLDKWASLTVRMDTGQRGRFSKAQRILTNRYFHHLIDDLLTNLEDLRHA